MADRDGGGDAFPDGFGDGAGVGEPDVVLGAAGGLVDVQPAVLPGGVVDAFPGDAGEAAGRGGQVQRGGGGGDMGAAAGGGGREDAFAALEGQRGADFGGQ